MDDVVMHTKEQEKVEVSVDIMGMPILLYSHVP